MYKTAVRTMIRRGVRALQSGDIAPILAGYANDAVLVFPGQNSWSGEYRGKTAIAEFLQRFVEAGLVGEAHDILVDGPPWRTTVCVFFTDRASNDSGEVIYQNRAILLARIVWGKIVYQEDFEDTQKVKAFDTYLPDSCIAGDAAFQVRSQDPGESNGLLERVIADGGEPLRCCLSNAETGVALLLFNYIPPLPTSPYRESGAIFIHAEQCAGPKEGNRYPAEWIGRPQLLRAYDANGRIHPATTIHDGTDPERALDTLLAQPGVTIVHSRNVAYGCYMFSASAAKRREDG